MLFLLKNIDFLAFESLFATDTTTREAESHGWASTVLSDVLPAPFGRLCDNNWQLAHCRLDVGRRHVER